MNILCNSRRIQHLTVTCTLLANCVLLWGCPQQGTQQPPPSTQTRPTEEDFPRYPAVVYDVPRCYDDPPVTMEKCSEKPSNDVYLNFDYLGKSDSVLWQDIVKRNLDNGKTKFWRLNVFRVSTGELEKNGSTYQEDTKTDWLPTSKRTVRMKDLPLEVLLRAEFEFCSENSTEKCDAPAAKINGRNINFLMHEYPEKAKAVAKS